MGANFPGTPFYLPYLGYYSYGYSVHQVGNPKNFIDHNKILATFFISVKGTSYCRCWDCYDILEMTPDYEPCMCAD